MFSVCVFFPSLPEGLVFRYSPPRPRASSKGSAGFSLVCVRTALRRASVQGGAREPAGGQSFLSHGLTH